MHYPTRRLLLLAVALGALAAPATAQDPPEPTWPGDRVDRCRPGDASCVQLTDADGDGDLCDDLLEQTFAVLYPGAGDQAATGEALEGCGVRDCAGSLDSPEVAPGTLTISNGADVVTDDGAGNLVGDVLAQAQVTDEDTGCTQATCFSALGGIFGVNLAVTPVNLDSLTFDAEIASVPVVCEINASGGKQSGDCLSALVASDGSYTLQWSGALSSNMLATYQAGASNTVSYASGAYSFAPASGPSSPTAAYTFRPDFTTPAPTVVVLPPGAGSAWTCEVPVDLCPVERFSLPVTAAAGADCDPTEAALPRIVFARGWDGQLLTGALPGATLDAGDAYYLRVATPVDMIGRPRFAIDQDEGSGNDLSAVIIESQAATSTVRLATRSRASTGPNVAAIDVRGAQTLALDIEDDSTFAHAGFLVRGNPDGLRLRLVVSPLAGSAAPTVFLGDSLAGCDLGAGETCAGVIDLELVNAGVQIREMDGAVSVAQSGTAYDGQLAAPVELLGDIDFPQVLRGALSVEWGALDLSSDRAGLLLHYNAGNDICGGGAAANGTVNLVANARGSLRVNQSTGVDFEGALGIDDEAMSGYGTSADRSCNYRARLVDAGVSIRSTSGADLGMTEGPNANNPYGGWIDSTRGRYVAEVFVDGISSPTLPGCVTKSGTIGTCGTEATKFYLTEAAEVFLGESRGFVSSSVTPTSRACEVIPWLNGVPADTDGLGQSAAGRDLQYGGAFLRTAGAVNRVFLNERASSGAFFEWRIEAPGTQFCAAGSGCTCSGINGLYLSQRVIPQDVVR